MGWRAWRCVGLVAIAAGGLGCGGEDEPGALCTATTAVGRQASIMRGPGAPRETWSWTSLGLISHRTFEYDAGGRLVAQRTDIRPDPDDPEAAPWPDGEPEEVIETRYDGATAEVILTPVSASSPASRAA